MSKFVVCVFDTEVTAYEGSKALQDLHRDGDLVVYAGAVVVKDDDGTVRIVDEANEGPIGTLDGMLIGTLIGAFGGPAGMLAGAAGGSLGGWLVDLYNVGIDAEFLNDVGSVMTPGKAAVVAEVSEAWTTPLTTRMEALGGTVFRRSRMDVEDAQIERDIEATNRDLDDLEDELEAAAAETKAKIQEDIDATKAKTGVTQGTS